MTDEEIRREAAEEGSETSAAPDGAEVSQTPPVPSSTDADQTPDEHHQAESAGSTDV
jgi:hypothetical protein